MKLKRTPYYLLFVVCLIAACTARQGVDLHEGTWRGVLEIQGKQLPFNFEITNDGKDGYHAYLKNASERLLLDEVSFDGDSVTMVMHIFDSDIVAAVNDDSLNGHYVKRFEKDYRIPFKAAFGQNWRFVKDPPATPAPSFEGRYRVSFYDEQGGDTTNAVGVFSQTGSHAEGTFLTLTGDYRYLEGDVVDGRMHLSTFDGNHTYLFTAEHKTDSILTGHFWSGKTRHRRWIAKRDESAVLTDAGDLTYLKDGFQTVDFNFPDPDGNRVTPHGARYHGKVLIIQIMGTWCPNCMDETRFLTRWYQENRHRDVEIIGLAYEQKPEFEYGSARVKKMKEKLGVDYEVLVAGWRNNKAASKTLPMLNRIVAFPTTIFVGRDGKVKKIHTGFSGPGTGIHYEQFKEEFNETVNELLEGTKVTARGRDGV